jgi:hypothetical protein
MTFTPDTPDAFDALTTYSQNPGAKTGPQTITVESADCTLEDDESVCFTNTCTCEAEGECDCDPACSGDGCFEYYD